MSKSRPSRTALGAAAFRAAHQTLDHGAIFADPLACRILGSEADALIAEIASGDARRSWRLFMAARSRFAEEWLEQAVLRGVRQAVILGAGLDTLSLRNPHGEVGLQFFEVDQPSTQAWKYRQIVSAGLTIPSSVTFVPADLERQELGAELRAAGFKPDRPAFFHWLGVVPYLQRKRVLDTLRFIASVPDAAVAFDYTEPLENYAPARRAHVEATAARSAAIGEPWLTQLDPEEISRLLRDLGFQWQEDLGLRDIALRYHDASGAEVRPGAGPHVIYAARRQHM